ncbi:MAG TPA: DEAD/DEAH box helicase [Spirochaetia bacterium]|nr:DEAD/DEAH box helicase [Spirochaetia bacterium]
MNVGQGPGKDKGKGRRKVKGQSPGEDKLQSPGEAKRHQVSHAGLKAEVRQAPKPQAIEPDLFQVQALEAACRGENVLVVAPTGAGKTWVAEQLAARVLEQGEGLMFASPIKALSNQKYREFVKLFGEERVGLITGDLSLNPGAQVIILTTEILRNKCMNKLENMSMLRWIVLDEFHLMDSDRGAAWEDTIIFAPENVCIVCLSATVPNYREIAGWMREVRKMPVAIVVEKSRPVPLAWRWFVGNRALTEKTARAAVAALKAERSRRHSLGGYRYTFREPSRHRC